MRTFPGFFFQLQQRAHDGPDWLAEDDNTSMASDPSVFFYSTVFDQLFFCIFLRAFDFEQCLLSPHVMYVFLFFITACFRLNTDTIKTSAWCCISTRTYIHVVFSHFEIDIYQ